MRVKKININLSIIFFSIYLFLSPLDMILNINGTGTILRYLGILIIVTLIIEFYLKKSRLKLNYIILYIFAFCFTYIFTSIWAEYIVVFPYSIINLALFYMLMIINPITQKEFRLISFSIILGALILSMYMILNSDTMQFLDRVTIGVHGKYVDPNDMGANLLAPFFFCLQYISSRKNSFFVYMFHRFTLVAISYSILITGSRGALLALIVGILVYLLSFARISITKKVFYIATATLICIGFFLLIQDYLPEVVRMRLTLNKVLEDKGSSRFMIWGNAIEIFKNSNVLRMLFGYGYSNFPSLHLSQYGIFVGTHNLFIQNLLEGGLVAFTFLIMILVYNIKRALKNENNVIFSILIATLVMSLSLETINKKFFWNSLIFASLQIFEHYDKKRKIEKITFNAKRYL